MMNSVFSEQILADKLSKLNSTQQCIETLSHWCIFHRSNAEMVVATWDKQFQNSEMIQKVPLLYLANDILQNSKRKGNEFVNEFWKVLPAALKDVLEKDDDHGKNAVSRLVNIWEQRKVFGSRAKSLKDVMLGEEVPPPLELNKKRSRSVRIMKRDSRSIRTKLSIGGTAEKIVSAFHLVLSEHANEDAEMGKCKSAVQRVKKIEKDADIACTIAKDPNRKILAKELEEQENLLKKCIEKLKLVEASRVALVSQLREALHEQESELENVRTQMQVAQAQAEEASNIRKRLSDDDFVLKASTATSLANGKSEQTTRKSAAAIAALADKLTASSSSQFIMSSVLSTFAAEEAKSAGMTKSSSDSTSQPDKSMPVSDLNAFMPSQQLITTPSHSYPSILVPQPTMQNHAPASQAQYHILPNPSTQQYMQPNGGVVSPYGFGNIPPLPPGPPPPPPHMVNTMVPLTQQQLQITQQHPIQLAQQPAPITQHQPIPITQQVPAPPSFRPLQPPGMVYYGNPRHSM
ncbi:Regulation of nuclear pre-mRNA domain-containing protein 1B [Quillaja saponaria]|uniref:Regulation of nuclear pre-mRNA domain-containing protein 1B n=1 Tax=Quillaja saponaria TaxID=32244 RepID=A0AAD7KUG2_QUISA|nr:Regulation of nuclear pre-mRNA domain-containing protein 1B [Quillaja saponaria]KAJ7945362.1 Regulation of nuclear pre-mRNA domain-containing protein 1B [Quillaja saponaria]